MKLTSHMFMSLSNLGLDANTLRAYSALSECGRATAAQVAKLSGLKRTTVYSLLDRLEEMGLVSKEQRAGVLDYLPSGPEALLTLAEERKRSAEESFIAAKELASAMRSREGREAIMQSKVQIFEGKVAINAMLRSQDSRWRNSLMSGNCTWLGFMDDIFVGHYGDWVIEYWKKYASKPDIARERVHLFSNHSEVNSQMASRVKNFVKGERTISPLPVGIKFSSSMWVVGDYVIIIKTQQSPHLAMVFIDRALADNLASIFAYLWRLTVK